MSKNSNKSGICHATRVAVSLPGIPIPTNDVLRRKISGLTLQDLNTDKIQTPRISIQLAAEETLQLLKKYQAEIDRDVRAVQELLQLNPYFSSFQWVKDAAERLDKCQRAKRKRGRPKWRYTVGPEVVLGLVWLLRANGNAKSDRDAADWLEISGIMSTTRVLRLLKQAKKDPRLKPLLSPPPNTWPDHTAEDMILMYETAITPQEGQTLRFELQDDHFHYAGVLHTDVPTRADENNS